MSQLTNKLEEALTFLDSLSTKRVRLIEDTYSYLTSISVTNWCEQSLMKRFPLDIKVEFTRYRVFDDRYPDPELKKTDNITLLLTGTPILVMNTLLKIATIEEYK